MAGSLIDRVRHVIDRVAPSHSAFGSMVGISKDKLSKSLAGARRFTSLELALIAEAGGVTVDWLLTGKAPEHASVAARTIAGATPDVDSVTELVDRHVAAFDVLDLLGDVSTSPPLPRERGEELAAGAVAKLGVPVQTLGIAELASTVEERFGIHIVIDRLPAGLDGLAWQRGGHRLIFLRLTKQWTRQRFTLAHELGHILAGDAQQILVDRNLAPGKEDDATEARASAFAVAFLMPAQELRAHVGDTVDRSLFAHLVVGFKVSPSAMAARLNALGWLGGHEFYELRSMSSLECHELAGDVGSYMENVNASLAARVPARLANSLFKAYREGRTTLRPLASLLDVHVDDLYETLLGTPESESVYSL